MATSEPSLGEVAFRAYCRHDNPDLPEAWMTEAWAKFNPVTRAAWEAAARTVVQHSRGSAHG